MSHFIGLVFINPDYQDVDMVLEPFDEQNEEYMEFQDRTNEVKETFDNLPDKDERLDKNGEPYPYPCDKEHYPTIESLAENWFGYRKINGKYGYRSNPNAKYDWYMDGGRWDGYLTNKEGNETNEDFLTEIDWGKVNTPFCFIGTDEVWYERGKMGWWCAVSDEKGQDEWDVDFKNYVNALLAREDADKIVVYAIDFHI